jgi:uncharacterized membrane protein
MGKARLEAFSDGVLAIIITIMVLEMKAPNSVEWNSLQPIIPKFLSFGLSFLFVAIYWVNHHHLLHAVSKITPGILWANFILLFWLSLIPFTTAWMGETHFEKLTVAIYALLALLCGVAYNILQWAIKKGHANQPIILDVIKPAGIKELSSVLIYTLSIPIAWFVSPIISGILFLAVSVIWIIPNKKLEKVAEKAVLNN